MGGSPGVRADLPAHVLELCSRAMEGAGVAMFVTGPRSAGMPIVWVNRAFERQTGMRVEFARAGLRDLESPGVSGEYTVTEALQRLVRGTGVAVRFKSADTVRLELAGPPERLA